MARIASPVAATRSAVRRGLRGFAPDSLILVACSGGADSVALACALGFVAPRLGLRSGLVSVDHGLQPGSAQRAQEVASWGTTCGFSPSEAVTVTVDGRPGGPEAAAREARYEAIGQVAGAARAAAVLLGHTQDDQAETVLLALARGAGPRGIAGMPAEREAYGTVLLRPFLTVSRAQTRHACVKVGREPWDDPHNTDPSYTRSRVRSALPLLADLLGPDVVANLARTARLVADDTVALDALAESAAWPLIDPDGALHIPGLRALPNALRTRVLRGYARQLGVPGGALSSRHIDALDALVTDWHGQGPVALPGGHQVARQDNRLRATAPSPHPS